MGKIRIGLPCTPSKFIKRRDMLGYKVKMSCGGGMGGSVWNEYLCNDVPAGSYQIIRIEDYTGRPKSINTNFVVKSEEVIIEVFLFDITTHHFYGSENKSGETVYKEIVIAHKPEDEIAYDMDNYVGKENYSKQVDIISDRTWSV